VNIPDIEGIAAVVIGVSDPDAHMRLWRDTIGFVEIVHARIDPTSALTLYGRDDAMDAWVLATPGSECGRLFLLHLPDTQAQAPWRGPGMRHLGPHSLDVYVRDFAQAEQALDQNGWRFHGQPRTSVMELGGQPSVVTEAALQSPPDNVHVQFLLPARPKPTLWSRFPDRLFTELTSSLVTARDIERELQFWSVLGFKKWYDETIRDPAMEAWLGLPAGTPVRITGVAGTLNPGIEVIGLDPDLIVATPPRRFGHTLGIEGYSLRCRDLTTSLGLLHAEGYWAGDPCEVETPLHGRARVSHLRTPGEIAVELWQPM